MDREGFILSIHQSWILRHGELRDLPKVTQLVNNRTATKSKASHMSVPEASCSPSGSHSSSLAGLPGVSYSFLGRLHLHPGWDHPNPSVHIHIFILSSQQTRIIACFTEEEIISLVKGHATWILCYKIFQQARHPALALPCSENLFIIVLLYSRP